MGKRSSMVQAVGLVGLLTLAACSGGEEAAPAEAQLPAVEAVAVSPATGEASFEVTGVLARQREAQLAFRVPGVITELPVDEGDIVRKGQLIARIDPTGLEAGRLRAQADRDQARRDLERDQTLFEKGFVSRQRLDDRRTALAAAEAAYAAAAFDRRWAMLAAPSDGVVLSRTAASGQVVQPGQAVVSLADATSPLILRAATPDRLAARVSPGAPAQVRVGDRTLNGRVILIGGESAPGSGTVDVEIEIPPGPNLRSGQVATARLQGRPEPGASATFARVPAEAIQEAQGSRAFVLRLDKGVARRTEVAFGGFEGDDALVAGLAEGSRVITAGGGFVGNGDKVQVVDARALAAAQPGAGS